MAATPPLVLRFPAQPRFAGVARTAVAAAAERLDLPVDRIEDLRLATSELVALAVANTGGDEHAEVVVEVRTGPGGLTVEADFAAPSPVPEDGFTWLVLRGLAGEATQSFGAGRLRVQLSISAVAVEGPAAGAGR